MVHKILIFACLLSFVRPFPILFEKINRLQFYDSGIIFSEGLETHVVSVRFENYCAELSAQLSTGKRAKLDYSKSKIKLFKEHCENLFNKNIFSVFEETCERVNTTVRAKRSAFLATTSLAIGISALVGLFETFEISANHDNELKTLNSNIAENLKFIFEYSNATNELNQLKTIFNHFSSDIKHNAKVSEHFLNFFQLNRLRSPELTFDSCTFDRQNSILVLKLKRPKILTKYRLLTVTSFAIKDENNCALVYSGPKQIVLDNSTQTFCEPNFDPLPFARNRILILPFCDFAPVNQLDNNIQPNCSITKQHNKTLVQLSPNGSEYFIYCHPRFIQIGSQNNHLPCPNFVFKLPISTSFRIGDHKISWKELKESANLPNFTNPLRDVLLKRAADPNNAKNTVKELKRELYSNFLEIASKAKSLVEQFWRWLKENLVDQQKFLDRKTFTNSNEFPIEKNQSRLQIFAP